MGDGDWKTKRLERRGGNRNGDVMGGGEEKVVGSSPLGHTKTNAKNEN